jgi:hypothetical protein
MSAKDPRAEVVKKALTDPAFKAALLQDPKAAVEKAFGLKLPAGVSIKVVEDSASVVHLVLPPSPAKGPLPDSALSQVAGGGCGATGQTINCPNNTMVW